MAAEQLAARDEDHAAAARRVRRGFEQMLAQTALGLPLVDRGELGRLLIAVPPELLERHRATIDRKAAPEQHAVRLVVEADHERLDEAGVGDRHTDRLRRDRRHPGQQQARADVVQRRDHRAPDDRTNGGWLAELGRVSDDADGARGRSVGCDPRSEALCGRGAGVEGAEQAQPQVGVLHAGGDSARPGGGSAGDAEDREVGLGRLAETQRCGAVGAVRGRRDQDAGRRGHPCGAGRGGRQRVRRGAGEAGRGELASPGARVVSPSPCVTRPTAAARLAARRPVPWTASSSPTRPSGRTSRRNAGLMAVVG